jgi:5-methyltetrahydropteroyltriglutamate--homocysteine methyltransferase
MRTSTAHILTSHVGSLPRPDALIEANRAREEGRPIDKPKFQGRHVGLATRQLWR